MLFAVIKAVYDRLSHSLGYLTSFSCCIQDDLFIHRKVIALRYGGGKSCAGPNVLMAITDVTVDEVGLNKAYLLCLLGGGIQR